jgi:hypothetical protein
MKASSGVMLVQRGDLHIGADWVAIDPLQTLSATVDLVQQLDREVDAVLALAISPNTAPRPSTDR